MARGDFGILIVHPDATTARALFHQLQPWAGHIEWCQEGVEGIRRCYRRRYDVVFVARWLRDMGAFEFVEKVRLRVQQTTVIILVESGNETVVREARRVERCQCYSLAAPPQTLEALLQEVDRQRADKGRASSGQERKSGLISCEGQHA
jgi:DNA-binding NtrC family response regulator